MLNKFIAAKRLIFVLILSLFCRNSFAQVTQDVISQQDWITRQQQSIMEEKRRNAEFEAIEKDHERKKKEEGEVQKIQPAVTGKLNECFLIKEINLFDADSLSAREKKKIVKPFIGKCIEAGTLANIIKAINDYYQSKGLVTTQVKVPKQNLQSGIFDLQIIEGKIEKISLGKDRAIEKMQEFTAFGDAEGSILNINDINQGIYQINRLQSNRAVMKIQPGSEGGKSKVIIDNNKKFPARLTIGKDNLGNSFTGVQRTSFSSSFDNLLSLNDNINVSYATNLHDNSAIKGIKSFSSGISIPFKYNTFSYDFSRSEFNGQNVLQNSSATFAGFSQSSRVNIDRILLNRAKSRLSGNISLTEKQAASYNNGEKSAPSERKLSVLNIGLTASTYFNDKTSIYLKPSYTKGLKILNAKKDQVNQIDTAPRAQFDYFKLYANFSTKFNLPKINAPAIFTTEMDSQYSNQTLYGSEQFSVGGYYSVRGFRENYISGDSGYYFRNKINFNLGSLIAPFLKKEEKGFFITNLAQLNKFSFEPFYDYGYAKYKYANMGSDGRLSGTGLKTIFNSKYFNASFTYSQATSHSSRVTSPVKENKMVYFEISASCC